jgi:hypothetical protein
MDDGYDDGVRWSLVQPTGWMGMAETVARGIEWWLGARIRARAMTRVVTALARAGAQVEIAVVEDSCGAHWTVTVAPPSALSVPVAVDAETHSAEAHGA